MVVRQGSFPQRVVNAWNDLLPGKVVAAETVDKLNWNWIGTWKLWRQRVMGMLAGLLGSLSIDG